MHPAPVSQVQTCVARFGPFERLGVAVSGGGDSVAALVLAVDLLGAARVAAVTVDHGLRAGSAAEAAGVGALCARLGVDHSVLRWAGPQGGNLQEAARRARLALIGGWARGRVGAVVLAHTQDDQAETLLMRLARGSGVDGLSAMAEARQAQGVLWLRPFLPVTRAALRDVLTARGIGWVDDPSNSDLRFQRVRARQALAALAPLGITAEGLARTAARLRTARTALEAQMAAALQAHVRDDTGTALIDKAALSLPQEIRDRVFAHLLVALTGAAYRPRLDGLHRLIADHGTLMGCVLVDEGAHLRLFREPNAVAGLSAATTEVWDGRWQADTPTDEPGVIRATGEPGLLQLSQQAKCGLHPHWRETGLPRAVLAASPAIWRDNKIIAAPLALWPQKWRLFARPVAAPGIPLELSH